MSVIVKGALTAGVLAVGCTGTYFLMTGKGNGPITLHGEGGTPDAEYSNKIGTDFKHLLVSPFNEKNKQFWEKAFKRWEGESTKTTPGLSNEFKKDEKVKTAFTANKTGNDNGDEKALNRVCYGLYKDKSKADLSLDDANKKQLTTDLFTYCSVLQGLPKTVKEVATGKSTHPYNDNTIGKTNEAKLASVEGNDKWWELKSEEFYAGSAPDDSAKFFKKLHTDENKKQDKKSLRAWCQQAYGKESSTSTSAEDKPTPNETLKYCSLLGS